MTTDIKYKIARYGDRKWIEVFREAIRQGFFSTASFNDFSGINGMAIKDPDNLPELLGVVFNKNSGILRRALATNSGLDVSLTRTESPLYDELQFRWNPNNQNPPLAEPNRIEIISWFTSEFLQLDPEKGLFAGTDFAEAAQNELSLRSATLDRIEQVQASLAEATAAFNKTIQDNYLTEKEKLDSLLEKEREKLINEFDSKNLDIDRRKTELDSREAEIDASDNTSARRQIRKDLLDELHKRSDKFALTKGTNKLRWPVHAVSLAIITGGLAGAFYFGGRLPDIEKVGPALYAFAMTKSLGLTFAAVGTAFFYLRWLNRWFEQHAQAEFKLKQFQLDIERASWLVETALDWDANKDKELPKELLESLSRNLFNFEDEKIDQVRHPVDELASALMGSASKVRLNLGGNEVELDGKRLRKSTVQN